VAQTSVLKKCRCFKSSLGAFPPFLSRGRGDFDIITSLYVRSFPPTRSTVR
jgi:hypothetical protein